jgi:hypothetical protein
MAVNIVCGPPGSGKTTWVKGRIMEGDIVVDMDLLGEAITLQPPHRRSGRVLDLLIKMKERLITDAIAHHFSGKCYNVWIVTGGARAAERENLQRRAGITSHVYVFEISPTDCAKHILRDKSRGNVEPWIPLIRKWWDDYEPRESDIKIRYKDLVEANMNLHE